VTLVVITLILATRVSERAASKPAAAFVSGENQLFETETISPVKRSTLTIIVSPIK